MSNYEDRHPNDMVLHPLTEIREWDEALAVLGIQDSDQTPADAIRERDAEIERLNLLHGAVVAYLDFLRRSLNVGPLTKNPTKEASLLRRMMELTAAPDAADANMTALSSQEHS